ncbi:MAG TPA: hybrid sensor histidine kinase/response regulator [Candidatus Aminicenantes bacterium]|nr:hybrid sensor histidine kinase/response regulator [Candidatus Aminicenantes bacterium]HEB35836.1 hybrid sensor histidine kinase/response regulator [Candidatus Aminicenantes bacterium]
MKKKQILVVEDERIAAEDIKMSLHRLGYAVSGAAISGKEAVKKAEDLQPDLVLMDIVLVGEMDGIEASALIRSRFDIPIVYLTAYADKKMLERAKVTEPFGYILKPFDDKELCSILEIALYKHKMERKLKKTQQELIQSEKLAALGRFSSGIAHEIKNPLGIILGGSEFLEMKLSRVDPEIKTAIKKIKESTFRADRIVKDLLKFSRPSILKTERIDPNGLIRETLSLFKYRTPLIEIKIKTHFAKEKMFLEIDKSQMQQVFFNLLLNAIESMPNGGLLMIKTYKMAPSEFSFAKKLCVIEIADTGEGISKKNLQKIFEPFFTTKREIKGTGLGLSMSKMLVNNHNGDLVIESKPGKGTTAKIILPFC